MTLLSDGLHTEIYFVVGIRSNFRDLLPNAFGSAVKWGFTPRILDVGAMIDGWRSYLNDWREQGLHDSVTYIRNRSEFSKFSKGIVARRTVFLFLYLPDKNLRPLWRKLQGTGARVGAIVAGPVPSYTSDSERLAGQLKFGKWWLAAKRQLKPRPDFWITAGSACNDMYRSYFRTLKHVPEIPAHSIDYERSLFAAVDENHQTQQCEKIVMLDQGWFSKPRPDFLDSSNYPPTTETDYSRDICHYLSYAGQRMNCEVVVACHPKADLTATRDTYPGFRVEQGNSQCFVNEANLVVANSTTAIQYAVLQNIPVVLFSSEQLQHSIVNPLFEGYRREINPSVVFIDDEESYGKSIDNLQVDSLAYEQFVMRYVKHPESADESLWEIVFKGIVQIGTSPNLSNSDLKKVSENV
ncbi:MAG: hypothetical protein DHS20C01_13860 [marine bacterium B5-7]|nr:MAG: hypothetical protein DHS20C01_13860 [marine bacterium B5-7]